MIEWKGAVGMLAAQTVTPITKVVPEETHLEFLRRRLRETAAGWAGRDLDDSELIADSTDGHFWELVGLRVSGHESLLLGALSFRRQTAGPGYSRQSLPSYLATDCPIGDRNSAGLSTLVRVELPTARESVSEFLGDLKGKQRRHRVLVDKELIQVMFDLRAQNPSTEKVIGRAKAVRGTVVLRTRDGHVVSGILLDLEAKLRRDPSFLAITMAVQHTVHGNVPLPTLFVQRRYISMLSSLEGRPLEEKLSCVPFQPKNANPLYLVVDV